METRAGSKAEKLEFGSGLWVSRMLRMQEFRVPSQKKDGSGDGPVVFGNEFPESATA